MHVKKRRAPEGPRVMGQAQVRSPFPARVMITANSLGDALDLDTGVLLLHLVEAPRDLLGSVDLARPHRAQYLEGDHRLVVETRRLALLGSCVLHGAEIRQARTQPSEDRGPRS